MSVLRRMLKMRQTAAWLRGRRAEPDPLSSADFGPAAQRSRFVPLCYKNWPFVSSGQSRPSGLFFYILYFLHVAAATVKNVQAK